MEDQGNKFSVTKLTLWLSFSISEIPLLYVAPAVECIHAAELFPLEEEM